MEIPTATSNPLYDLLRSARPGSRIPVDVVSARVMSLTMNAPTNSLFMGSRNGSTGAMENQPHGPVHVWTGDTTMRNGRNDMGVLSTAAQDPVFFSHHGNIDRLWSVWLGLSPQHQNFTDQAWLSHGWEFYDENSVWTRIAVSDVIDPVNTLRCAYQPPSPQPVWSFTRRPPRTSIVSAEPEPALTTENAPATTPLASAPITQSITVPPPVAEAFAGLTAAAAPQYVLHIEGIEVPPTAQTLFRVYLNLPDATARTGVDVPNFVGTVTVLVTGRTGAVDVSTQTMGHSGSCGL
jgi:polyphenol oxidase